MSGPEAAEGGPPLLLHSLAEFAEVITACIAAVAPRRVLEIGGEGAAFTRALVEAARPHGAEVVCVEPVPSPALRGLAADGLVTVVEGKSPQALAGVAPCDVYVVDGDHNHWVVSHELEAIFAAAERPLVVLHDVAWPAARRDQYYDPADVPEAARRPYSYEGRAEPGRSHLGETGFYGAGAFAYAVQEGGPRNGVLTAVEDFAATRPGLRLRRLPCIFGLGFLYPEDAPWAAEVDAILAPLDESPLLDRLERNRLALFLEVLRLQAVLERERRGQDRVIRRLQRELEAAETELLRRSAEAAPVART